jgi:TolB-like protein/tetratricopeptide (TPR) repeat protein
MDVFAHHQIVAMGRGRRRLESGTGADCRHNRKTPGGNALLPQQDNLEIARHSGIAPDAIRNQLAKIIESSVFADSRRMARFLRFAVEETLKGNASRLKEIVIGTEVFDRAPSYDPRLDPIVRVEARRLRAKLGAYYENCGENDVVVVEFPKGRYVPAFRLHSNKPRTIVVEKPEPSAIAVLPFANLDAEKGCDYFSDGLSEELIHALTRIQGLMVVAWTSAAQLRERQEDIGAVGQRLNVAHVLRGSVRRIGERLRIAAQLIATANGHYVWSETYDREACDIFAIQEEIATAIANALKMRFSYGEGHIPAPRPPCDPNVYQLCLKGRFHARERTSEGLKRSLVCFEQAIALDNGSAAAYAGLADAYTLMAEYGFADGYECIVSAKAAAQRALALDPASAEAHASLGLILSAYDWSWLEAQAAFERALAINPGYASAHHWYAVDHLAVLGRHREAAEHLESALKLDPLSPAVQEGRAFLFTLSRRYDDAIEWCRKMLEIDPSMYKGYTSMGRALLQKGMYREAIEMLQKGRALNGEMPSILGAMGQAHGLLGNVAEARELLRQLEAIAAVRPVSCTSFALVHVGLGERDSALTWLERGVSQHQSPVIGLKIHPAYDDLRSEPRFQSLLVRIGLAD